MSETPRTLEDLARHRRTMDRPTHVHVVGDLDQHPPKGIATAKRVAHLLVAEDGTVREENHELLEDGDVAFLQINAPAEMSPEEREKLRTLAHLSRTKLLAGIVVFAEAISSKAEDFLDARVVATSGGIDRVTKLEVHPLEARVYERELDGLVEKAQ